MIDENDIRHIKFFSIFIVFMFTTAAICLVASYIIESEMNLIKIVLVVAIISAGTQTWACNKYKVL
jgi:hypothetical protein